MWIEACVKGFCIIYGGLSPLELDPDNVYRMGAATGIFMFEKGGKHVALSAPVDNMLMKLARCLKKDKINIVDDFNFCAAEGIKFKESQGHVKISTYLTKTPETIDVELDIFKEAANKFIQVFLKEQQKEEKHKKPLNAKEYAEWKVAFQERLGN